MGTSLLALEPGLWGLVWGCDLLSSGGTSATNISLQIISSTHRVWDQPILHLHPSYKSQYGFFFKPLVVGLPFSRMLSGSEWWLFWSLVIILIWCGRGSVPCLPTPPSWPETHLLVLSIKFAYCGCHNKFNVPPTEEMQNHRGPGDPGLSSPSFWRELSCFSTVKSTNPTQNYWRTFSADSLYEHPFSICHFPS